jgi:hypothetical protein
MSLRRHPGEGPGPGKIEKHWIPASAGMTRLRPSRKQGFWIRGMRLKSTALRRDAGSAGMTEMTPVTVSVPDSLSGTAEGTMFLATTLNN